MSSVGWSTVERPVVWRSDTDPAVVFQVVRENGSGGVSVHNDLTGRAAPSAHPATGIDFVPSVSGDWATPPADVAGALDELGARSTPTDPGVLRVEGWSGLPIEDLGGSFSGPNDADIPFASALPVGALMLLTGQTDPSHDDVWRHTGSGALARVVPSWLGPEHVGMLIAARFDVSGNPQVGQVTGTGVEVLDVTGVAAAAALTAANDAQSTADAAQAAATTAVSDAAAAQADVDALGMLVVTTDCGAAGDGTTDDTAAFEAAMTALAAGPKRVLFIPPGDFLLRRPVVPPSGCEIRGVPGRSRLFREHGVASPLAVDVPSAGETTVQVVDSSVFAVGDDVVVSDTGNFEWNGTHATVTAIDGGTHTLTIDNPTLSPYSAAVGGGRVVRVCSLIANHPHHENTPLATPTTDVTIRGLVLDHNAGPDDPDGDFTVGVIHWENAVRVTVEDCQVRNAATDGISDQGRTTPTPGVGSDQQNAVTHCVVTGAARHGVHLGSSIRGVRVSDNVISDCGWMALFLCAHAQHTVFTGNVVTNCRQGVGGADTRQPDDGDVTPSTPYDDIVGDISTVVTGNTFIGGPLSDANGTLPAITLAAQSVASGNTIRRWNGGIWVTPKSVDCVVTGNTISFGPDYASGKGIEVGAGAHRCIVIGNNVRGGGFDVGATKQDLGVSVEDADHVTIADNVVTGCMTAMTFVGTMRNLSTRNNKIIDTRDSYGAVRIYGTLSDSDIDLSGFDDPTVNTSPAPYSFHDGAGAGSQVRLRFNGVGHNGTVDPAVGGPWHSAPTAGRYDGVRVLWDNDGTHHTSVLSGTAWTEVGGGAALSDADPEPPGAADAGTAVTASRADHVHAPPSASDITTGVISSSRLPPGVLFGQGNGPSVTATSLTTLLSSTPTITAAVGDHLRIVVGGSWRNEAGSAKSFTLAVTLAGVTVCSLVPIGSISSGAIDRIIHATIDLYIVSTSFVRAGGSGFIGTSNFTPASGSTTSNITTGLTCDLQGMVQSGGSQTLQADFVTIARIRA